MARKDWVSIGVNSKLTESIDEFLQTDDAKTLNLKSRQDFVNILIYQFFERYKEATGKDFLRKAMVVGPFDLIDKKSKKIKK